MSALKTQGTPKRTTPTRSHKNVAQRHSKKQHNIPEDLPEIRFLQNIDKSFTVEEALHKVRVHTCDCFIEQTVPQEEFRGLEKFVIIILPNRI